MLRHAARCQLRRLLRFLTRLRGIRLIVCNSHSKGCATCEGTCSKKLQRGEAVVGPFMNCSCPAFIEITGLAGFDFAIIDTEHGPLSIETAEDLCRAGQLAAWIRSPA